MLHNANNEELIKICAPIKPESEFTHTDHLIVELIKRVEAASSLLDDLINKTEELDEAITQIARTSDRFRDLIDDYCDL
jgi:hypothetical protein